MVRGIQIQRRGGWKRLSVCAQNAAACQIVAVHPQKVALGPNIDLGNALIWPLPINEPAMDMRTQCVHDSTCRIVAVRTVSARFWRQPEIGIIDSCLEGLLETHRGTVKQIQPTGLASGNEIAVPGCGD